MKIGLIVLAAGILLLVGGTAMGSLEVLPNDYFTSSLQPGHLDVELNSAYNITLSVTPLTASAVEVELGSSGLPPNCFITWPGALAFDGQDMNPRSLTGQFISGGNYKEGTYVLAILASVNGGADFAIQELAITRQTVTTTTTTTTTTPEPVEQDDQPKLFGLPMAVLGLILAIVGVILVWRGF